MDNSKTITISLEEYNVLIGNDERITAVMNYMNYQGDRYVECGMIAALLGREYQGDDE